MKVCITGIAGFIGSHLADELVNHGYEVCGIDNLDPQVHGPSGNPPAWLNPQVKFIQGDVRSQWAVQQALRGVDAVVHLAASVGVGQSAYRLINYVHNNSCGTACLLEEMAKVKVSKLIVASSMSVYGEGEQWSASDDDWMAALQGQPEGLRQGERFPIATRESHLPDLQSIYALTKYDQERLCLLWGRAFHVPTIALRFFNTYGPRQSLNNPYTGALAIFASRLLNNQRPIVFEDGYQSRDFVYVTDVARAVRLALESDVSDEVINVGTGIRTTILQLAEQLAHRLGKDILPEITHRKRVGDIRYCWADIGKAKQLLGYQPEVSLVEGIKLTVEWLRTQQPDDNTPQAIAELEAKGLLS